MASAAEARGATDGWRVRRGSRCALGRGRCISSGEELRVAVLVVVVIASIVVKVARGREQLRWRMREESRFFDR